MGSINTKTDYENFYEIKNIPSKIAVNNFYLQLGLLFGIFMD
jgi:hypothetical protein